MKKYFVMVMLTAMSANMAMVANTTKTAMATEMSTTMDSPTATAARKAAEAMLSKMVKAGCGSASYKDAVLKSGIIEEVANTLVETNFDFAAATDKAAEVAVRQKWFKSKAEAKRALRRACERARKDASLVEKVYQMLGI